MVYQETSLVPALSVAQNIYLGRERLFNRLRGINIAAQQALQSLNFPVDPAAAVGSLGAAKKQMVEIARAVEMQARIIIFDEPTATLTPEEKHHFFALIRRLKAGGVSIVFISHALEEALELADRHHRAARRRDGGVRRRFRVRPRPGDPRDGRPRAVHRAAWRRQGPAPRTASAWAKSAEACRTCRWA